MLGIGTPALISASCLPLTYSYPLAATAQPTRVMSTVRRIPQGKTSHGLGRSQTAHMQVTSVFCDCSTSPRTNDNRLKELKLKVLRQLCMHCAFTAAPERVSPKLRILRAQLGCVGPRTSCRPCTPDLCTESPPASCNPAQGEHCVRCAEGI